MVKTATRTCLVLSAALLAAGLAGWAGFRAWAPAAAAHRGAPAPARGAGPLPRGPLFALRPLPPEAVPGLSGAGGDGPDPTPAGVLLEQADLPTGRAGLAARVRLLQTGFKYAILRVEELRARDPVTGRDRVVQRLAMVGDHVLVRVRPGVSAAQLARFAQAHGAGVRRALHSPGLYLVSVERAAADSVPVLADALAGATNLVAYAEPDYLVQAAATFPNDSDFAALWGMNNTGQSGGTPDADIDAPEAWDYATGSTGVVVAIIDTGVLYTHPDLAANAWSNSAETVNGLDDDGNGFVDDVRGWDFCNDDSNPVDDQGHGTHVAGTIGGVGNNGTGVAGVNWAVRLMALKFLDASGNGAVSDAADAIHYAALMRGRGVPVRLTSNSWGGGGYSQAVYDAIEENAQAGLLFVAASGNGLNNDGIARDNDTLPHYPSSYALTNIVAVTATDPNDALASFGNYGLASVDLSAPGVNIRSTYLLNGYTDKSGTSMATPHVAGVAALIWSLMPASGYAAIRDALFEGVDPVAAQATKTSTGGRLNALGALRHLDPWVLHEPLLDSMETGTPYAVEARLYPAERLDTNALWLFWSTNGTASALGSNRLEWVSNDVFRADIPAQPLDTVIDYWLEAGSDWGSVGASPAGAPAARHRFAIVPPVLLIVDGIPDYYGTVVPDYGYAFYPSGRWIEASAVAATEPTNGGRQACSGWTGIGSVPASGSSNRVAFRLCRPSGLSWQWRTQYALVQTGSVAGAVNTQTWWDAGSTALTETAAASLAAGSTNYRFASWFADGERLPDAVGPTANPTPVPMPGPRTALALYLPDAQDEDADLLPDWWEWFYFGGTNADPFADADGDWFLNLEEFQDGADPRDPASFPAGPALEHTPLPDPQGRPAPWAVAAVITDRTGVAVADLCWKKNGQTSWRHVPLADAGSGIYTGAIPAPGVAGDTYYYQLRATDSNGYETAGAELTFDVVYPIEAVSPAGATLERLADTVTNLDLSLSNAGNTNLLWSGSVAMTEFADDMENGTNAWTHSGANDLWKRVQRRATSGQTAWYCGNTSNWKYVNGVNARLVTPPVRLQRNARLTFRHWIRVEMDTGLAGHAWDGGVVEISTNNGASYTAIAPEGGYPYQITPNVQSPFAAHTPCFAGTGEWRTAVFDLSAYTSRSVRLAFRFGSDLAEVDEGWYVDDVAVESAAGWLAVAPLAGDLPGGASNGLVATVDTAGLAPGGYTGRVTLVSNDPVAPTNALPFLLSVRTLPQVLYLGARQTSVNGQGLVTVSNAVADADRNTCSLDLRFSTNNGASWTPAWLLAATASVGQVAVSNGAVPGVAGIATTNGGSGVTNRLTLMWATTNETPPLALSTATWMRAQAWDGTYWGVAVTSQPFLVDNQAPSAPTALTSTSHRVGTWSSGTVVQASWAAASDGAGVGLAGYDVGFTSAPPGTLPGFAVGTSASSDALGEGTNWTVAVRARDLYGNVSAVVTKGPYWIDAAPPSAVGAVIAVAKSVFGDYVVGTNLDVAWSGFSDSGSGIAAYYVALADGGGTTNGVRDTGTAAAVRGAAPDATNRVYVWAQDRVERLGAAAVAPVLVVSPGGDWDLDGSANGAEELAGTDAADAGSVFELLVESPATNAVGFVVHWQSVTGRVYSLFWTNGLGPALGWTPLEGAQALPGAGGDMSHTDTNAAALRFYRLTVEPAP